MPVRNADTTLRPAIRSVLRQSMRDIELVAVDDGSEDGSGGILSRAAADDPRVRVFSPGRVGLVKALNIGLAESRSGIVARMDADDFSHPDRLGLQLEYLNGNPDISLVSCLVRKFPRSILRAGMLHYESWLNSVVTPEEVLRDLFIESPLPHPSVMFRKSAVMDIGGYRDMGWPEDYDLWLRLAEAGHGFGKVPRVLLYWRESAGRISRRHGMYSLEAFREVRAHFLSRWKLASERKVQVWGAGRDGKAWAKLLMKHGIEVDRFIDIDHKKVGGQACGGVPVVWPADIDRGLPVLGAVGIKGVREQIRDYLLPEGFREPEDFFFLA